MDFNVKVESRPGLQIPGFTPPPRAERAPYLRIKATGEIIVYSEVFAKHGDLVEAWYNDDRDRARIVVPAEIIDENAALRRQIAMLMQEKNKQLNPQSVADAQRVAAQAEAVQKKRVSAARRAQAENEAIHAATPDDVDVTRPVDPLLAVLADLPPLPDLSNFGGLPSSLD